MNYRIGANDPKKETRQPTVETLVIQVGETWLAVRASRLVRLLAYQPQDLVAVEVETAVPGLRGRLGTAGLPLLDLAALLELPQGETAPRQQQIMLVERNGLSVGFLINTALEIERARVEDIFLLPKLIEEARLKPVVWALWQRSEEQILPLIEPLATLGESEWRQLETLR